ncbi:hypothetical protein BDR07DRAFT_1379754 [Suillus spraguei]|nr:hypothetical protein BDR07DRAFT_1379754 [Suillus spraguei]
MCCNAFSSNFYKGSLTLLNKPFDFTGYLVVGPQPVLYVLYCSAIYLQAVVYLLPMNTHNSQWEAAIEVPIFIKNFCGQGRVMTVPFYMSFAGQWPQHHYSQRCISLWTPP